jgi:hypothetical protein
MPVFTVRIMNEFLHGPVWALDDDSSAAADGSLLLVEVDPIVQEINDEASFLFDSH